MDEIHVEKITKDIISNSKLELTNPDFNNLLMQKIRSESYKQSLIHNLVLYFLIFISFDAFVYALLKLMKFTISDLVNEINIFLQGNQSGLINLSHSMFALIFVIGIVIFSVKLVSVSQFRYK